MRLILLSLFCVVLFVFAFVAFVGAHLSVCVSPWQERMQRGSFCGPGEQLAGHQHFLFWCGGFLRWIILRGRCCFVFFFTLPFPLFVLPAHTRGFFIVFFSVGSGCAPVVVGIWGERCSAVQLFRSGGP